MSPGFTSSTLPALVILCALAACSGPNAAFSRSPVDAPAPVDAPVPVDAFGPGEPRTDLAVDAAAGDPPPAQPGEPPLDGALPADAPPAEALSAEAPPADAPPADAPPAEAPPAEAPTAEAPIIDGGSSETPLALDLVTGLIGYWRMDEPANSDMARDSSGLNHHGKLENLNAGNPWTTSGWRNSALNISDDDKNAGVRVEATTRILNINHYTVAAWVRRIRLRPTAYQSIISRQRGESTAEVFDMSVSLDRLITYAPDRTSAGGATSAAVGEAAPVNTWFHAAASFDGAKLRIYQNGVLRTTTSWVGTLPASDRPLYLGTNKNESGLADNHHVWEGQLDEVLLYDVALPDEAIAALAGGQRPPVP